MKPGTIKDLDNWLAESTGRRIELRNITTVGLYGATEVRVGAVAFSREKELIGENIIAASGGMVLDVVLEELAEKLSEEPMSSYSEPLTIEDAQRARRKIDEDFEQAHIDHERRIRELKRICSHRRANGSEDRSMDPIEHVCWCIGCNQEL
jgi:hypothetical protein